MDVFSAVTKDKRQRDKIAAIGRASLQTSPSLVDESSVEIVEDAFGICSNSRIERSNGLSDFAEEEEEFGEDDSFYDPYPTLSNEQIRKLIKSKRLVYLYV